MKERRMGEKFTMRNILMHVLLSNSLKIIEIAYRWDFFSNFIEDKGNNCFAALNSKKPYDGIKYN